MSGFRGDNVRIDWESNQSELEALIESARTGGIPDAITSQLKRPCLNYAKTVFLDEAAPEIATWSLQQMLLIIILIEVWCDRDSALGKPENTFADILVARVCEEHDFAKTNTVDKIVNFIRHDNVHVHLSTPRTGGSPFNVGINSVRGFKTQLNILAYWTLHD